MDTLEFLTKQIDAAESCGLKMDVYVNTGDRTEKLQRMILSDPKVNSDKWISEIKNVLRNVSSKDIDRKNITARMIDKMLESISVLQFVDIMNDCSQLEKWIFEKSPDISAKFFVQLIEESRYDIIDDYMHKIARNLHYATGGIHDRWQILMEGIYSDIRYNNKISKKQYVDFVEKYRDIIGEIAYAASIMYVIDEYDYETEGISKKNIIRNFIDCLLPYIDNFGELIFESELIVTVIFRAAYLSKTEFQQIWQRILLAYDNCGKENEYIERNIICDGMTRYVEMYGVESLLALFNEAPELRKRMVGQAFDLSKSFITEIYETQSALIFTDYFAEVLHNENYVNNGDGIFLNQLLVALAYTYPADWRSYTVLCKVINDLPEEFANQLAEDMPVIREPKIKPRSSNIVSSKMEKDDILWEHITRNVDNEDDDFKCHCYENFDRLEKKYRKKNNIREDEILYNNKGYIDDDFLCFVLGYLMANKLFDGDDKLVVEAVSHSFSEAEVDTEYDEVNSWEYEEDESWDESSSDNYDSNVYDSDDFSTDDYNRDEIDFDELEFMEPWERRQALEDAGFDPDDFDFDYDPGSGIRNVTFQDDYGFDGDDMYDFDGEFRE